MYEIIYRIKIINQKRHRDMNIRMMLFGINYTNINIMKGKENRGALVNYVGRHHQSKA